MTTIIGLFEDYGYVLELLTACVLFVLYQKRRKLFPLRVICVVILMFAINILYHKVMPQNIFMRMLTYLLLLTTQIAGIWFCFEVDLSSALFCGIGAGATQHLAFKTGTLFRMLFLSISTRTVSNLIYVLFSIPAYVLSYFVFARRLKNKEIAYLKNVSVMLLSVALTLYVVVIETSIIEYQQSIDPIIIIMLAGNGIISTILTLCVLVGMFKSGAMQREQEILRHLLNQQKMQMEMSKSTIDLINVKCHDLKHQISLHGEKLGTEKAAELEEMVLIYDSVLQTGNEALDIILTEKSLLFKQNKVKLDCMTDGKCLDFMSESDIYSLFGNALDNAFEAVKNISDTDQRMIGIHLKEKKGMLSIHIQNNYTGEIFFENGLPVTTKTDKKYHGFGMKSIQMLVEKYGGSLSLNVDHGIFNVNILIPVA